MGGLSPRQWIHRNVSTLDKVKQITSHQNILFQTWGCESVTQSTLSFSDGNKCICLFLYIKTILTYFPVHSFCVVLLLVQEDLRVSGWPSPLWGLTVAARTLCSGPTVIHCIRLPDPRGQNLYKPMSRNKAQIKMPIWKANTLQ